MGTGTHWPLVGDAIAFRADVTGFLLRIAREQGDIARFRIGRRPAFLLSHPDHVRAVLVEHADKFHKGRLLQRARRLLGNGLLTSEGEFHRTQRRQIQPAFTKEQLKRSLAGTTGITTTRVERWVAGRLRIDSEMDALTMAVVSESLLGTAIELKVPELRGALHLLARWSPLLMVPGGRILERLPLPFVGRLGAALDIVDRAVLDCVATGAPDAPLLSAMRTASGGEMSQTQMRDEVMTIFLAGHDTTAATLIWIWLLLAANPDDERRMHDELDQVLGGRAATPDDIPHLRQVAMVVDETLRLYPPIGRMGRRPIQEVALDGVTLPIDASVFVSPFVTHRDPRWYPDPGSFLPARWEAQPAGRPRFAWFPFGAGPRSCIGEHFARMVLVLAVATIAQRWTLRPVQPGIPAPRSLLTVKPRGAVWMAVSPRRRYAESAA